MFDIEIDNIFAVIIFIVAMAGIIGLTVYRMHKKNNGPIIDAQGPITLNTFGKTTNAKPVPSVTNSLNGIPLVKVMNPKIEKIPIALNTSNPELENATIKALSVNLESSGR